jgi:hypothetical protein
LPLLGNIHAAGMTPHDLEAVVGAQLKACRWKSWSTGRSSCSAKWRTRARILTSPA